MRAASRHAAAFILAVSAALSPGAAAQGAPERAASAACSYARLEPGLIETFSGYGRIFLSADKSQALFQSRDDRSAALVNLRTGARRDLAKPRGDLLLFAGARAIALAPRGDAALATALAARSVSELRFDDLLRGASFSIGARTARIARLYSGNFVLKVFPADLAAFEAFKADLLRGVHCGKPIAAMTQAERRRIAANALLAVWDDLSLGRIDDFAAFSSRAEIMRRLLPKQRVSLIVDTYCFRLTETLAADPVFSRVDPAKVWNFAWAPVAKLLGDKDWVSFTDLSTLQKDGSVTFTLLGTDAFEQGELNRFGFYHRRLEDVKIADIQSPRRFEWKWPHGGFNYHARFQLSPAPDRAAPDLGGALPAGRNGVIILDGTLTSAENTKILAEYLTYFKAQGFTFGPPRKHGDLKARVGGLLTGSPRPDYILRDGHADGDDENLLVLRKTGMSIAGRKASPQGVERVVLVANSSARKDFMRPLSYDELTRWLAHAPAAGGRPIIYLDTSCWGVEKANIARGFVDPARMLIIAARDTSNYFSTGRDSAGRVLLDALRNGATFETLRARLRRFHEFQRGLADGYVFPDEPAYHLRDRALRIERRIEREKDGVVTRYLPDGYL